MKEGNNLKKERKIWHHRATVSRGRNQLEPQLGFSLRYCTGPRRNLGLRPLSRLRTTYCCSSAAVRVRPRSALLRKWGNHRNLRRSEPKSPRHRVSLPVGTGKSQATLKPRGFQAHRSPRFRCLFCIKSLYTRKHNRNRAPNSTGSPEFNRSHLT